jgi:phosphonate transport system permease protein
MSDLAGANGIDVAALKSRHRAAFAANWRVRLTTALVVAAMLALYVGAFVYFDVPWGRLLPGLNQLAWFVSEMAPPDPGGHLVTYVNALGETLAISCLGTLLGALFALPLGVLAARNVVSAALLRLPIKRFFDGVRGIDTLIWALIWINVVGLGPFAGILAIMTSDFGAFGKLFSEAIEATDSKAVEGVVSSGGGHLQSVRFGLLPQVLPVFLSQILYFFESNTRSATIIGIVGAGGIGASLYEEIQQNEWPHVAFLVLMILVAVAVIDMISTRLRVAIIGARPS